MSALAIVLIILAAILVVAAVAVGVSSRRPRGGAPTLEAIREAPPAPPPKPPGAPVTDAAPTVVEEPVEAEELVEALEEDRPVLEAEAPPRFRDRLGKARGLFSGYLGALRSRSRLDQQSWDELEEVLIRADVGVPTTTALLDDLRAQERAGSIQGAEGLVEGLRAELKQRLGAGDRSLHFEPGATNVWLFVGVNGVGKTTTIGKVARRESAVGRSVVMAAGDTFRAAAAEQHGSWAAAVGADLVRGAEGGDPGSVVFDAVQRAAARGSELVLADTAGRLHTKVNLMEELKKVRRVSERPPGHLTEVLLVLDATTGQNGLVQARQFTDAVGVTGLVLTKLDGTARGGIVLAIREELGLPIKLVGLGEGPEDLVEFDPDEFVDALLD